MKIRIQPQKDQNNYNFPPAILSSKVEPYVLIIHTGTNNPALDKIEKWEDGRMSFILNPQTPRSVAFLIIYHLTS